MLQQATVEIIPKDATVEFPPDPFYKISAKINAGEVASFNTFASLIRLLLFMPPVQKLVMVCVVMKMADFG